ncbi:unnamed protein product, partial [Amoebophrya sp. A25]
YTRVRREHRDQRTWKTACEIRERFEIDVSTYTSAGGGGGGRGHSHALHREKEEWEGRLKMDENNRNIKSEAILQQHHEQESRVATVSKILLRDEDEEKVDAQRSMMKVLEKDASSTSTWHPISGRGLTHAEWFQTKGSRLG